MRENGHPQWQHGEWGDTGPKSVHAKSDQARPHAASQQSSRAHTTPLTRCSTAEVARRQSTPEKVPGLRAQADAWRKVSGARKGPCARLSGECGRLVLTLCYRRYRRLTFGLEVTLFTPRAARSIRGAGGHCDSHGRRLEELRLLLDDLSCAMPASSASSASNVRIITPERREQS